jgi:general secretion pathway protein G
MLKRLTKQPWPRFSTQFQSQSGFTLIEILIVMIIIAFLASLSAGSFQSSQRKSRDARRKADLNSISTALEAYYNDKGEYPNSSVDLKISGCGATACDWGARFYDDDITNGATYMEKLPSDPSTGRGFTYAYVSNGESYQLYARFENLEDPSVPHDASDVAQAYTDLSCGVASCNYGISSTNTTVEEGRNIAVEGAEE